jgi:outer membrane lipase/esterase
MSRLARFASSLVGLLFLLPSTVSATHFDGVFIFGDSLSDTGNVALLTPERSGPPTSNLFIPDRPYPSGRFSNNGVWVDFAAPTFGFSAVPSLVPGGTNYAFGGARTGPLGAGVVPSLLTQFFVLHLPSHPISANALYIIAGGGNNARDAFNAIALCMGNATCINTVIGTAAFQFAQDINEIVEALEAGGARHILVWNVPDIGETPILRPNPVTRTLGEMLAAAMNAELLLRLADDPHVQIFDLFTLVNEAVSSEFGFLNTTDACGAHPACDPARFFFWDAIHPTSGGHALLAQLVLQQVPAPATLALLALGFVAFALRRRKPE